MTPEALAKNGTEDGHQMALFAWARLNLHRYPHLHWLHAIPNGGHRSVQTGAKMKATGARKGVWDVFLPVPIGNMSGLYLEMKKPKPRGRLSPEQVAFQEHLEYFNYVNRVCYTWEEAVEAIEWYLSNLSAGQIMDYKENVSCPPS